MNPISIGKKIQKAREEKGMSQEQLANAIGCSQAALSNYEKGKRRIYLAQLEKLSESLEKPMEYFIDSFKEDKYSVQLNLETNPMRNILSSLNGLSDTEIEEVESFIAYLKWRKSKEDGRHGPLAE